MEQSSIAKAFRSVKHVDCDETKETCAHILIPHSDKNSITLQADYVAVVEDRPTMSAKYRLPPSAESTGMEQARKNGNVQLWTSHMMMMMMMMSYIWSKLTHAAIAWSLCDS